MGKYKNHEELAAYAPWKWRRNTTQKSYLDGMNRIAPPGKKARERRGTNFEEKTALPQSVEWHHNWDLTLFDGSEIEHPESQARQRSLEEAFPPPRKEPYLPPYPRGKESLPPAGTFLPHTVKKEPDKQEVIKEYRVEENKPYGTWAVVEMWAEGTVRSPFNTKEEAIKREEEIGRYYGWKLKRVEFTPEEIALLDSRRFPKRTEALYRLKGHDVIRVHGDGDLTVRSRGKFYVVTREGQIFEEKDYLSQTLKPESQSKYRIGDRIQSRVWSDVRGGHPWLTVKGVYSAKWMGKPIVELEVTDGIQTNRVFADTVIALEPGSASRSKPARVDVRVEVWSERDRLHIGIQDKVTGQYVASWWDEEAREMMEQGFFYSIGSLGWRIPVEMRKLEDSVLDYAEEQGLLSKVKGR